MTKKRGIFSAMVLTLSIMVAFVLALTSVTATQGCSEDDQGFYRIVLGPFGYSREFICKEEGYTITSQFGFEPFNMFDRYERRARIFSYYRVGDMARYAQQVPHGVPPHRIHPSSQYHGLFDEAMRRFFGTPPDRRHPSDQQTLIYGPREASYLHQYIRFTPFDKVRMDQFPFYHLPETLYKTKKLLAEGKIPPRYDDLQYGADVLQWGEMAPRDATFRKGPIYYGGFQSTIYGGEFEPLPYEEPVMGRYERVKFHDGVY